MIGRDEKIYREAAALWLQIHGEPPPDGAGGAELLALILGEMPETRHERLATPHLRASNIAFPKYA